MNKLDDFKIRLQRGPWGGGYDVILMNHLKGSNDVLIIEDVTIKTISPDHIINPLFNLNRKDAQILMDDLWDAGVRPSEGTGSAGALAATQKHLDDMRKIVFKELEME